MKKLVVILVTFLPLLSIGQTLWWGTQDAEGGGEFIFTTWTSNSYISNGFSTSGYDKRIQAFEISGTFYCIEFEGSSNIRGYYWNGSSWSTSTSIISGIGTSNIETLTTIELGGTTYLIVGLYDGNCTGYYWNGSSWSTSSYITNGIGDAGSVARVEAFRISETPYLLSVSGNGYADGYYWNGSSWSTSTSILSGLSRFGYYGGIEVFEISGTVYLLSGINNGGYDSYIWNGSSWTSSSTITNGLPTNLDEATPTVILLDGYYYMLLSQYYASPLLGFIAE